DEILSGPMVNAGFATDARVHLSQESGGNLYDRYTAHVNRSGEASHISHNSSADGNHGRLTSQLKLHHSIQQPCHGHQRLGLVSIRDKDSRKFVFDAAANDFEYSRL